MIATILQNTNTAISSADSDWSFLRNGTFVKFGGEDVFYIISKTERANETFKGKLNSPNSLSIDSKINGFLNVGDDIKIILNQHTLWALYGMLNKGSGYKLGDELTLQGGVPVVDNFTGQKCKTKLKVTLVNINGEIEEVELLDAGKYHTPPDDNVKLDGGNGNGAEIKVAYREVASENAHDRTIKSIDTIKNTLELDVELPSECAKTFSIHVSKWKMFLTSNFVGASQYNVPITFIKDSTPYNKIPLLLPNSLSTSSIYNLGVQIIDKKLYELEKRLVTIESKKT